MTTVERILKNKGSEILQRDVFLNGMQNFKMLTREKKATNC